METDDELVQAYWNGDETAFEKLHARYSMPLWLMCKRLVRDPHIAEDMVQDTFSAFHSFPNYRKEGNFKAFIFRIARNASIHWAMRRPSHLSVDIGPEQAVDVEVNPVEAREVVEQVMDELLPSYRELIAMYYLSEMSSAEIGKLLDITPPAVRRRLHTAREEFRKKACSKLGL